MTVRVKNLESGNIGDNLTGASYKSVGRQTDARVFLLYFDIRRVVCQDRKLTPRRVAAMAGFSSDWIVRDIRKPGFFVKNVAHLFDIEESLRHHPKWQPKTVYGEKSRGNSTSFVYRRWVDPRESPEFKEDAMRWADRRSDAHFLDHAADDPWSSILDVTAEIPQDYRFETYAAAVTAKFGVSKKGTTLRAPPGDPYCEILSHDFHSSVGSGEARCKDVVQLFESNRNRVIFRNIALPCLSEGRLVTKTWLERWEPGRSPF